jgi:hypothetical protein
MSLFWKILVFDEGTESADIATNENILLLDEYSKVKLFLYLLHWRFPKVVPLGAIVIRTRYDEGTESGEVATSGYRLTRIIQRPLSAVATVNEAIDSEWNITTGLFGLGLRQLTLNKPRRVFIISKLVKGKRKQTLKQNFYLLCLASHTQILNFKCHTKRAKI